MAGASGGDLDNAVQIEREGTTDEYTGTATTTPAQVPAVAGNDIVEISIRSRIDQPEATRLEFSFDGTNYFRLGVGEAREEEPLGYAQVYVKATGDLTTAIYEIIMNRKLS